MLRLSLRDLTTGIVLLLVASNARAQGVGFQGGVALDPSQVYVGTYFESLRVWIL